MKSNVIKAIAVSAVFGLSVNAYAGGIDALKKFNNDANGLSCLAHSAKP